MLNDKNFMVVSFCTFAIMITKGWFEKRGKVRKIPA